MSFIWRTTVAMLVKAASIAEAKANETTIAVAANFTDAAKEIAAVWEKKSGHKVNFSFGATGGLFTQISQGAPFDVFLSADQATVKRAVIWFGALVAWVTLIPLIAVSVYDMIGRQFFHVGSTRLQELEWHFFLAVVMLGLGYAYLRDAHVRIDILRDRLTLRTRAWIELFGCLLVLVPFCMMLIVHAASSR